MTDKFQAFDLVAAEIAWQNFYNGIKHQLGLKRELRLEPAEYISTVKTDYDRLFEISPICNQDLITKTRKQLQKNASADFQIPNYLNAPDSSQRRNSHEI